MYVYIYIYTYTHIYICIYSTCISSFGPGNAQFQSFPGAHYGTTSRSLDRGAATRKVGSWETLEATKKGDETNKTPGDFTNKFGSFFHMDTVNNMALVLLVLSKNVGFDQSK